VELHSTQPATADRSTTLHRVETALLGTAAVAFLCMNGVPPSEEPHERTCEAINQSDWTYVQETPNLNIANLARLLRVDEDRVRTGMVGFMACNNTFDSFQVPTDEIVAVTGAPTEPHDTAYCVAIPNDMLPPRDIFGSPKAVCPGP
jgi:hypothetical protein